MPVYNNTWVRISEPNADFTTNKCVVKVESWSTEADKINGVNPLPTAMCVFSFTAWDFEAITSRALEQYANWVPYDEDKLFTLLLPTKVFSIIEARQNRATFISKACEATIVAGFNSSALGASYMYPSQRDDQLNLSGTIQRSTFVGVLPTDTFPFLCKNSSGVWAYQNHTPAQIQQVGKDAYNFILAAKVKNATLQAQIAAATTQAQLDAIVW